MTFRWGWCTKRGKRETLEKVGCISALHTPSDEGGKKEEEVQRKEEQEMSGNNSLQCYCVLGMCVCVISECEFECVSCISSTTLHWQQEINIGLCYWPHDLSTWISLPLHCPCPPLKPFLSIYLSSSFTLSLSLPLSHTHTNCGDSAGAKHTQSHARTHTHQSTH